MKFYMRKGTKTTFFRALFCGFLLSAAAAMFPIAASCGTLPENVMRLRVVANSNAPEDQAVKLKVRDAVLEEASKWYGNADSREQANTALCLHLESVRDAANAVLRENGFSQPVSAQITDQYFPTRDYEGFTLPAGEYRTLQVTIGEGKGRNWWCVAFPALCLPAAEEDREDALALLPEAEREAVEHPQKYRVEFKIVELYEGLRAWFAR